MATPEDSAYPLGTRRTLVVFAGLALLDVGSPGATRDMIAVGFGPGLGMQTFVLVVQNAVPQSVMRVARSTTRFSRTVAVTVMDVMPTSHLDGELADRLPRRTDEVGSVHGR